ncbi:hypothetical protein IAT38_000231 [Cryptococcus sp. DSM 104549]
MGGCLSSASEVTWEEFPGGPFKCFSLFYDMYGLDDWPPNAVQERIIQHPLFAQVGECKVSTEQKPNGRHEIEFRKSQQWTGPPMRALNKVLDDLPGAYHWWGAVNIRPHLKKRTTPPTTTTAAPAPPPEGDTVTVKQAVAASKGKGASEMGEKVAKEEKKVEGVV